DEDVDRVAARTIKADGTVVDVPSSAIFDRTVVKTGGVRLNVKSFAMPAVEPGSILEYRWRELHRPVLFYRRINVQREIPVRRFTFGLKPVPDPIYSISTAAFQAHMSPFEKGKDGFSYTTLRDIPAFREEPQQPPDASVKMWILTFYVEFKSPHG